jgi:hypothetical protein
VQNAASSAGVLCLNPSGVASAREVDVRTALAAVVVEQNRSHHLSDTIRFSLVLCEQLVMEGIFHFELGMKSREIAKFSQSFVDVVFSKSGFAHLMEDSPIRQLREDAAG